MNNVGNQIFDDFKSELDIAIIGAGFSGICMAISLKKAGFSSFKIFEKASKIGGTWRDNTYPGAGCDVPSFLYSFSFEPKSDWTQNYPKQPEILQYLKDCADKYDVTKHIDFNCEIGSSIFDSKQKSWNILTKSGKNFKVKVLISGCGQLNKPKLPNIPGINEFEGTQFHSANWNHRHHLEHKRIAVVGTGASAIQFIPLIAKKAQKLYVFQRSANWILSKRDRKFTSFEYLVFKTLPLATRLYRWWNYILLELLLVSTTLRKNSIIGKIVAIYLSRQRNQKVKHTISESIVKPDFPVGCKRVLLSNNYYETLQRPNVELISNHIKLVKAHSVVTKNNSEYSIDTLIFATGFDTASFLSPMEIIGLNNQVLKDVWKNEAEAYKGIVVSGFPNLFMLYGPNTNTANSIIFMIECQVRYIMSCIHLMKQNSLHCLEVKPDIQSRFNHKIQASAAKTVWSSNCNNWYKTDEGKIINNWPLSTLQYFLTTAKADLKDFYYQ